MTNYFVTSKSKHCKCLGFLILMFVLSLSAGAQTAVTGIISDKNGPVPGANVNLKGTSSGTSSDFDGKYSIKDVPSNGVLVFSFLGYKTKEVTVSGRTTINVTLEEESNTLKEIVVIGYGAVRKEAVTGSVSTIAGKELGEFASGNVTQALQARLPGVELTQTSTKPGASMQIRIRGTRSLTANNDPLIVLDGVPFAGAIGDINPVDIKSLDILKDASATAIYGSRGANGVVLITTNKGRKGQKAKFTYNGFGGVKNVFGEYDMMDGNKFAALRDITKLYSDGRDEVRGTNTDWQGLLYDSGQIISHDVAVTGGSEGGSYTGGLGYYKEESVLPGQSYERFSLRASLDQEIGTAFRIGFTTNNNYAVTNGDNIGPGTALSMSPLVNPYDADGNLKRVVNQGLIDDKWVYTRKTINGLGDKYINLDRAFSTYNNIFAELKIPGVDGLKYRLNSGLNLRSTNNGYYEGQGVFDVNAATLSNASISNFMSTQWLLENLITYDKTFAQKHTINFVGLYSNESYTGNNSRIARNGITSDAFQFYNMGQSEEPITITPSEQDYTKWGLRSAMARLMYSYDNRYFISGTIRSDGSSRLADGHKWVTYPAVSAGWTISNESFMKNISWLSSLKLRAGYGETSNQAVDPYKTLGSLNTRAYNFGTTNSTGVYVNELPNSALGWEYSQTMNYGLDFGFFNSRLTGTVEYYNTQTKNLLQKVKLPTTTGVDSYTANVGTSENKGYEISLNGVILDNPNGLTWTVGVNFYANQNQIKSLASGSDRDVSNLWFVGHNIASIYDYKKVGLWQQGDAFMDKYESGPTGVNDKGTVVGSIKVAYTGDYNADGSPVRRINENDRQIIDTDPDFQGGFNTNLTYKGFDFNAVGAFRSGGILISTLYGSASYLNLLNGRGSNVDVDYWTPTNTGADFPNPNGVRSGDNPKYMSTMGYFDGSYLKIRSITLGYTLQQDFMKTVGIDKLRIYASVQNPFVFFSPYHDMSGMDPETNSLGDQNQAVASYPNKFLVIGTNTPSTRNFLMGLNLTF
ncbi:SusC/RagA family TonB-linked outer membrane protein [Flavobacterium sp. HJJ]|uniref:SusC/RagA family TonB-linked outer membrane protein n=1 Tax=Flavobacterium sp. HJJ TaxID=2783792 RepID=UPI001889F8A3|nr:TonB-dependent receptor [Flavobacterium sp. HJJ]MBF4470457.1 TonB-dependent receptor [Flavobacterium sp. HJJ]